MGTKLFQVEVHEDAPEVIIDLFKAEFKDVVSLYEKADVDMEKLSDQIYDAIFDSIELVQDHRCVRGNTLSK